ncbi:hypothetical protein KSF_036910 [Reticulibacter mediterranei]|uniref:Uncharacterized protein n=1 Tax=Reticulibacter mediterranei TaxID=2778369 RepID=A0A8J3IJK1_9CHLR|nr:hypothetical protein KSF_036910 [Reticulibacter mediterranei]
MADRFKGAARIKGTKLVVIKSNTPPCSTEEAARGESQDIKRQLRSMGIPYTQTEVVTIRGEDD